VWKKIMSATKNAVISPAWVAHSTSLDVGLNYLSQNVARKKQNLSIAYCARVGERKKNRARARARERKGAFVKKLCCETVFICFPL